MKYISKDNHLCPDCGCYMGSFPPEPRKKEYRYCPLCHTDYEVKTFHEESFKPLDRIMSAQSGDHILIVDEQINQWVFAHDCNGRKYELDCVNRDVYRVRVGDF